MSQNHYDEKKEKLLNQMGSQIEKLQRSVPTSRFSAFALVTIAALIVMTAGFGTLYFSLKSRTLELDRARLIVGRLEDQIELLVGMQLLEATNPEANRLVESISRAKLEAVRIIQLEGVPKTSIDSKEIVSLADGLLLYRDAYLKDSEPLYRIAIAKLGEVNARSEAKYYMLVGAHLRLGDITGKKEEYQLAESSLNILDEIELERQKLTSARDWNARGNLALRTGKSSEAQHIFEKLVNEEPNNPVFVFNLAAAQAQSGNFQVAIKTLEQLVQLQQTRKELKGVVTQRDMLLGPEMAPLRAVHNESIKKRFQDAVAQMPPG